MEDQWVKSFIDGLTRLPNLQWVHLQFQSKDENVEKVLKAVDQAKIFANFQYKFDKL